MDFKQFYLEDEAHDTFVKIVNSVWPDCDCEPGEWSKCNCQYADRELKFVFYPGHRVVHIAFSNVANKEPDSNELRSGTVEGMHKFIQFAVLLKQNNLGISYATGEARRASIYAKALTQAGMQYNSASNIWR